MSRLEAVLCTLARNMSMPILPMRFVVPAALLATLLVGCATGPAPGPRDPGEGASPAFQARPVPFQAAAAHELSPAAAERVVAAETLLAQGEPEAAVAELERALRIQPGNPRLWQRMAAVRLELNQADQAEALARKSNRLAADNPAIQSVNWRLIAEARRLRDDQPGYEAAMYRARELQGR